MTVRPEEFNNYGAYYEHQLEDALMFQDFVTDRFYERGLVVVTYASKEYQHKVGENKIGIEIKYDHRFRETGNLFIETAEKSHPSLEHYSPSGIYREDNSWLYAIGDKGLLFLFAKRRLQEIEHHYQHAEIPTARGFKLPLQDAKRYALQVYEFENLGPEMEQNMAGQPPDFKGYIADANGTTDFKAGEWVALWPRRSWGGKLFFSGRVKFADGERWFQLWPGDRMAALLADLEIDKGPPPRQPAHHETEPYERADRASPGPGYDPPERPDPDVPW